MSYLSIVSHYWVAEEEIVIGELRNISRIPEEYMVIAELVSAYWGVAHSIVTSSNNPNVPVGWKYNLTLERWNNAEMLTPQSITLTIPRPNEDSQKEEEAPGSIPQVDIENIDGIDDEGGGDITPPIKHSMITLWSTPRILPKSSVSMPIPERVMNTIVHHFKQHDIDIRDVDIILNRSGILRLSRSWIEKFNHIPSQKRKILAENLGNTLRDYTVTFPE